MEKEEEDMCDFGLFGDDEDVNVPLAASPTLAARWDPEPCAGILTHIQALPFLHFFFIPPPNGVIEVIVFFCGRPCMECVDGE